MKAVSELTPTQISAVTSDGSSYLHGPAGTGKSTVLRHRLLELLRAGEQAYTVLVIVSELAHRDDFEEAVRTAGLGPYTGLKILTYNALAQEVITLFWPLIAREAGFPSAGMPPTFLSYDLAQLLMWKTLRPLMEGGMFADLRLRPQQIVSQILDTLNRAALNRLTLDEAEARQINSWSGDREHLRHLHDASSSARRYRQVCLENNLLDLSLVVKVFDTHLVGHPELRRYFNERFRHLLVDNVEEQTPAGQNFLRLLINTTDTAAIVFDSSGGYKRFLGADPDNAKQFQKLCTNVFEFEQSFTGSRPLIDLSNQVENFLTRSNNQTVQAPEAILLTITARYRRQMVSAVVEYLSELIAGGAQPGELAIVTPYLDGALRYNLTSMMKQADVPYRIMRRRSAPREEPRVRAWLTWLALAHPSWGYRPASFDVAEALDLSISGLDPARAQIVVDHLYDQNVPELTPILGLPEPLQQRVGWENLSQVEELRLWMNDHGHGRLSIDRFLYHLFSDLLAQPRYQPQPDLAGAAVCDWLVRSASHLDQSAGQMGLNDPAQAGKVFIEAIFQGLVSAGQPDMGDPPDPQGVVISTMYSFLLSGLLVRQQIWLDASANGWWDIPRQPLSNAFVLTKRWKEDQLWTMEEDFAIRNQLLSRIVQGLVRRCDQGVVLATSDLDRRGSRQDGPLWRSVQQLLK